MHRAARPRPKYWTAEVQVGESQDTGADPTVKLHGTAEGDWRRLRLGRRQASWCTADSVKIQFGSPKPDVEMTVPVTTTKFSVSLMVVVTAASYTAH